MKRRHVVKLLPTPYPVDKLPKHIKILCGLKEGRSYTTAEVLALSLISAAVSGRQGVAQAFKEICDRVEGKVSERVEVTGAGGEPLDVKLAVRRIHEAFGYDPEAEEEAFKNKSRDHHPG